MASDPIMIGTLRLVPNRELARGREAIALGQKALDLLSMLAAADGALVTKDELMAGVWPGVIVEENAIQVHIAALRKAMGLEGGQIQTVRGLGYRLVREDGEVLTLARDERPLIAVLAFDAAPDEPGIRNLAEGIAEELLYATGRLNGVRVIASASSFQFRGAEKDIGHVVSALRASHVLDGTVRQFGKQLRVGVQLVETAGRTVVWSDRSETSLDDLGELLHILSERVARVFGEKLIASDEQHSTDGEAYSLFLQGRRLAIIQNTRREGIALLEAALVRDPRLAPAWATLALVKAIAARWDVRETSFADQARQVREAVARALALNPASGTAHFALGMLEPTANFAAIEARLDAALALSPGDSDLLLQRATLAYTVGRNRAAFTFAAKSFELDPLSHLNTRFHDSLLAETGEIEASDEAYRRSRARWPGEWGYVAEPWLRAAMRGDWNTVDEMETLAAGADGAELGLARVVTAALRDPQAMRPTIISACRAQLAERGSVNPSTLVLLSAMGFNDDAFDWVELSDYSHLLTADGPPPDSNGFLFGVLSGTSNTAMRSDPRFLHLCKKLGLTTYWLQTGNWPDCADDPSLSYDFRAEASL